MAGQEEVDYEKQFQDDIEKATALSMETLALDQFRRSKIQYPNSDIRSNNHFSNNDSVNNLNLNQSASYILQQNRLRPSSFDLNIVSPPNLPPRRHSEGKSSENDLISFTSPTTNKTESSKNINKLIEDIQKLNTQEIPPKQHQHQHQLHHLHQHQHQQHQILSIYPSSASFANNTSVASSQLVPYNNQKAPLTNEQLQQLYNMPNHGQSHQLYSGGPSTYPQYTHQQSTVPSNYQYSVPPVYGFHTHLYPPPQQYQIQQLQQNQQIQHMSTTQINNTTSNAHQQQTQSTFQNMQTSETALVLQNSKLNQIQMPKSASTSGISFLSSSNSENTIKNSLGNAVTRRSKKMSVGTEDLIDLNKDENSRVSVLEAFDPLLTGENEYGDSNSSDCTTSYYAEYDPFDYLYSGGTQYSDPVYEAVNKQDRSPGASIGWRSELMSPEKDISMPSTSPSTSTSTSTIMPPPLPPRNSSGYIYEQTNCRTQTLDRRKNNFRLYEMVTDRKSNEPELMEFYYMVKELRLNYKYDDLLTNVGHVVASEFSYQYPADSIKILVHPSLDALNDGCDAMKQGVISGYGSPIVFTCAIDSLVELVIGHTFCALEGQIKGTVDDFTAKPIGVSEWLSPSSKLSQLECVHDSLNLEMDVQLGLYLKTEKNMQVIARTHRDDIRDSDIKPEDILPNESASTISYDNMMILIETLETEMDKLESSATDCSSHGIVSCSGVVQGVKAICALLGSIDTLEIVELINDLKNICANGQIVYTPYGTGNSTDVVSECGDYAEVTLRPKSTLDQIKMKCNQIREAVQDLISIYANAFRVDFFVKCSDYAIAPLPISCVIKPVMVNIGCLHRPPVNWKYDDYVLGSQIYHGTRAIGDPVVTQCSNDINGGIFPRLKFDSWISFEKSPICTLPRESRMIFVLYGTGQAENDQSSDNNQERKQVNTELGWCAVQLFNYQREMVYGCYLLSIWPPTTDKFLGPAPAKGCHPQSEFCPVLSIEVPTYGGRIVFPEPVQNPPLAPCYDFNSLDCNLQQELIDTAEQGYPGDLGKREVFWEKRHYLQNFPHALPKVLHAAHSWDYASLMDLHSLLNSWYPLSPLQALELLLPRYPDGQVRSKATEWIAKMPNDQLVDFLPQLLQALKHDTYEASAMSRFLLSKCLESPRIAHHLYWLLVHSLPGDAPQNTIDSSSTEYDESLITQARYYRRNKMMLRAILAICGEKLLSRFLSQNMMCKTLAEVAQSVKQSKDSLRQKTLAHGLESVHHALVNTPTSLPLGPGLEVSGVNIRSCSYFNSNTLPLKIAFLGPDNDILPAIFKCGDDLQQDMLTIQLVRVMNKLWLSEGLDLKMVTFECVPTGYKKGMIELVSDAETLRKIQVEYGLTGSFKDRPIAEWLAKQNPSQYEYERAVSNFTVSCAGYSVATYILGICDRHNDNIMLKTSGHLFHIDFGKFLGDAQMFGNFKRDRTPFVLTSDMAYVINGGDKPSANFHNFVDLCCRAFNIVRKNGDLVLHMLALMATAGIPGVTADAVSYVRRALLPAQSNPEAAASFAKMIQFSLKSWFTQFNFFLHNIAQMRFSNDEGSGELLSFIPRKYTMKQDGKLNTVMVHGFQKRYDIEKYYTYILRVTRHGQTDPAYLFRSYKEFSEFHQKLCLHFPLAKLHSLPSGIHVGRSNVKSVAERRLPEIRLFLVSLFKSADELAHSDLVYTFFHPLLRDQQESNIDALKMKEVKPVQQTENVAGEMKISLQYRRDTLTVMIHHARGLPLLAGGQEPNTYVKCYLKPDPTKATKRKTKVVRKSCVPSFMETLEYRMPLNYIQNRILHVTVWSHDTLQENALLGGFQLELAKHNIKDELQQWFRLGYMARS